MNIVKTIAAGTVAIAAGIGLAAGGSSQNHTVVLKTNPVSAPAAPATTHTAAKVPVVGQPVKAGVFTFTVTKFQCATLAIRPSPVTMARTTSQCRLPQPAPGRSRS